MNWLDVALDHEILAKAHASRSELLQAAMYWLQASAAWDMAAVAEPDLLTRAAIIEHSELALRHASALLDRTADQRFLAAVACRRVQVLGAPTQPGGDA